MSLNLGFCFVHVGCSLNNEALEFPTLLPGITLLNVSRAIRHVTGSRTCHRHYLVTLRFRTRLTAAPLGG
jgi:hypothetical protein